VPSTAGTPQAVSFKVPSAPPSGGRYRAARRRNEEQLAVGIKDFFSAKGRLSRHIKTVTSPYTQSADRYHAMEKLFADGSDEAFVGLLKRFTMNASKSIEDEEEKGWVYRRLSGVGKPLLPALKAFCLEHDNIAWALRILEDIANEQDEWDVLEALIERHPPGYERDPAKKIQLLTHVQEIDDDRVPAILARYLADPDETVRFFVVDALIEIGEEGCKDPLLAHVSSEKEDSVRLKTRLLDGLASLKWDLGDHRDAIAQNLGSEHVMKDGKIVRR